MKPPAISLLTGRTTHRREKPFVRSFAYRVAMIDVDIDRLAESDSASTLFAVNRANVIALREIDHGARHGSVPLRFWAETRFASAGVSLDGGAIRLITFPRVLGHGFAPISLWLGFGPEGALRGVIYEVHNTFGETHAYVSAFEPDVRVFADKEFFVSPFFGVEGRYRFTLRPAAETLGVVIENIDAEGRSHVATLNLRRQPFTTPAILAWLATMPFSGLGVIVAVHWQALILLLKGAFYRAKPVQRAERTTIAGKASSISPAERPRKRA
jgi:DUF1365 family protein